MSLSSVRVRVASISSLGQTDCIAAHEVRLWDERAVIARSVGIGCTAIGEHICRAAVIGITWPVPEEFDDAALERKLCAFAGCSTS
jgi:hypothetical protein